MLKIFGIPTLNTAKVILTAEALNLSYEFIPVDLPSGGHKTPEFLARNPMGRVPVIEHKGLYLFESNAICRYLAEVEGSTLYTGDSYTKALINQWIDTLTLHVGRWLTVYYFQELIRPTFFQIEPDQDAISEAAGFLEQQLPVLDTQLKQHPYLAGGQLSIADTIGFAFFHTHEFSSASIEQYPNINRWYQAIRKTEFFTRAEPHITLG